MPIQGNAIGRASPRTVLPTQLSHVRQYEPFAGAANCCGLAPAPGGRL